MHLRPSSPHSPPRQNYSADPLMVGLRAYLDEYQYDAATAAQLWDTVSRITGGAGF
jgi:hypothetical protein